MKKKAASFLKYLFFLSLGVFLVWWSLHKIPDNEFGKFKQSLANAKYWLIAPVFIILVSSHIFRTLRWKILMEPMGYTPSFPNTFFAVMIGYLANLAIPRLGEVLKCTILSKYEKVPVEKLVGTIVAERAFDIISLAFIFLIVLTTQFAAIGDYTMEILSNLFKNESGHFSTTKVAILIIALLVVLIALKTWFRQFAHLQIVIVSKRILRGIWEGLTSIRNLKRKWTFIFYTVAIWSMYIGGTWVGLYATEGTSNLGLQQAVSCLAFGSIGMIITPGGIGAYAYFISKILEQYDVNIAVGLANGTLQWFAQFLIIVIIGFICMGLLPWYNKKQETKSDKQKDLTEKADILSI